MSSPVQHIFLIPGFFGFASFGKLRYFAHVEEYLQASLSARGIESKIHHAYTLPTSSIRQRAARILELVVRKTHDQTGPIHLIGHSTGGLDARLATAPSSSLPTGMDASAIQARIQTVVSLSSPHHGTPIASFFNSLLGRQLLRVLAVATVYTLRFGKLPLALLVKIASVFSHLDGLIGWRRTLLDELNQQLLSDFSPEVRASLEQFFKRVATDQSLLLQLTPEGTDLLNAGATDRLGVRYACATSLSPRPSLRTAMQHVFDPYAQAVHALYAGLYRVTSQTAEGNLSPLDPQQRNALERAYGRVPDHRDNDGVVPTRSQVWGEVIHAARADHLDVVGHFKGPKHDPPHIDWLATGSRFRRPAFEALWSDIASFIADP